MGIPLLAVELARTEANKEFSKIAESKSSPEQLISLLNWVDKYPELATLYFENGNMQKLLADAVETIYTRDEKGERVVNLAAVSDLLQKDKNFVKKLDNAKEYQKTAIKNIKKKEKERTEKLKEVSKKQFDILFTKTSEINSSLLTEHNKELLKIIRDKQSLERFVDLVRWINKDPKLSIRYFEKENFKKLFIDALETMYTEYGDHFTKKASFFNKDKNFVGKLDRAFDCLHLARVNVKKEKERIVGTPEGGKIAAEKKAKAIKWHIEFLKRLRSKEQGNPVADFKKGDYKIYEKYYERRGYKASSRELDAIMRYSNYERHFILTKIGILTARLQRPLKNDEEAKKLASDIGAVNLKIHHYYYGHMAVIKKLTGDYYDREVKKGSKLGDKAVETHVYLDNNAKYFPEIAYPQLSRVRHFFQQRKEELENSSKKTKTVK